MFLGELNPFTQPSENQTFTQYISGVMIKPLQTTIDPETNEVQVPIEPTIIQINTKPETNEGQVTIKPIIEKIESKKPPLINNKNILKQFCYYLKSQLSIWLQFTKNWINFFINSYKKKGL